MPSLYRPILTDAWRLVRTERRLLGYGVLASLAAVSGFGSAIARAFGVDLGTRVTSVLGAPFASVAGTVGSLVTTARAHGAFATIGLALYGLVLLAILAVLAAGVVLGVNAITVAAVAAARGERVPKLTRVACAPFWRTAGIQVIAAIVRFPILAWWGATLGAAVLASSGGTVRVVATFVVTITALVVVDLITAFAIPLTIMDAEPLPAAYRESFALLRAHGLIAVETSLILTAVQAAASFLGLLATSMLALPFLFLASIGAARGIAWAPAVATSVGLTVIIVALACIVAVATTITVATWALLALRLTGPGEAPDAWLARVGRR